MTIARRKMPGTQLREPAAARSGDGDDRLSAGLRAVRERLTRGVLITAERLQEAIDDAVHDKRIDRRHAEEAAGAGWS